MVEWGVGHEGGSTYDNNQMPRPQGRCLKKDLTTTKISNQ